MNTRNYFQACMKLSSQAIHGPQWRQVWKAHHRALKQYLLGAGGKEVHQRASGAW